MIFSDMNRKNSTVQKRAAQLKRKYAKRERQAKMERENKKKEASREFNQIVSIKPIYMKFNTF